MMTDAQPQQMTREEIIRTVQTLIRRIPGFVGITRVYAYGSQVRGDATSTSDLDLLVEVADDSIHAKRAIRHAAWELSLEEERVISTVVVTEDEFRHGLLGVSSLGQNVAREGVEIAA